MITEYCSCRCIRGCSIGCLEGVPAGPYIVGKARVTRMSPSWLRAGVLVVADLASFHVQRSDSFPGRWKLLRCLAPQVSTPYPTGSLPPGPTPAGMLNGPARGYPGVISSTVAPERLVVDLESDL
jgi:hypothetical protein